MSSEDDATSAADEDYGVGSSGPSDRAEVLVEEFWDALSRTGVEIVGNMNDV